MSARDFEILYKETRLNLEPSTSSSIVQIRVGSHNQSSFSRSTTASARAINAADDEKAYRTRNIATASSVYYRKHHASPRAFHWRVLENDTVLSIRAADVCKPNPHQQHNDTDAPLVLNLRFPSPIRTSCIGFSDPEAHDALCVHVVDQFNQLHTITLRPDHFRKRPATDGGLGEFCKSYSPPGFGFKQPHRLVAVNHEQLIVTMHDGGILRFDRHGRANANGAQWKETIYNVAGWGQSLQKLVPFKRDPTVRYGNTNMELTAATSTAITNAGIDGAAFLFTICLDHRMRVWDVRTGQIMYTGDILNAKRDPQDIARWTIDPSQTNLIRIVDNGPGQCLVVTYSPIGSGEFKFWKVKANAQGSIHVADCFPEQKLVPASPSSLDIWTLADFAVAQQAEGPELWTLWKNNITYRVQKLQVRPGSASGPFDDSWKMVNVDSSAASAQTSGPCDPVDSTEKWLDLVFFPGRFTKSTLETALVMYEKGLGTYQESNSKSNKSIAESICSVLGATTTLDRSSVGGPDYEQFRGTSETQWTRFWRLLLELDKQRGEALSLVLDPVDGMIWVACADLLSAIRHCSDLDRIYHNIETPSQKDQDVAALVSAGLNFVDVFSDSMLELSRAALRAELFEESSLSDAERMQQFYDKAGFWRQVTEEDVAQAVETLGHNFQMVTPRLYEDLFELITAAGDRNSQEVRAPFTGFGRKLVIRTVQETIELHWKILFSQLILLVHMEDEIEDEKSALHARFDVGLVYRKLVDALKRLEHLRWMVKTELTIPVPKADHSSSATSVATRGKEETYAITALEGLIGHLLGLPESHGKPLLSSITDVVLDICAPTSSTELDNGVMQCWLLKQGRPDLAKELNQFAQQDPFSTYIQGRVFLALNEHSTAAQYFKKASVGLSTERTTVQRHSAGLLDDTEWKLLYSGLPNYYAHVVNLFERQRAYSYVVEFSKLALQFIQDNQDDENSSSQRTKHNDVKTEMLSRLFTASTAISQFDVAHSTLLAMVDDEVLQKSYLRKLVEKMCEAGQNTELVNLPFSGLQTTVDEILVEKCRQVRDVLNGVPYHQILYAWRISHNDYRGAASILLDRLQKLRQIGEGDKVGVSGEDALDTQVTRQYLLLINALSCVQAKGEAYIFTEILSDEDDEYQDVKLHGKGGGGDNLEDHLDDLLERLDTVEDPAQQQQQQQQQQQPLKKKTAGRTTRASAAAASSSEAQQEEDRVLAEKLRQFSTASELFSDEPRRRLLTLADIRKQYQQELDRIVAIQNNQFGFSDGFGGDDGDILMS
ncbi:nucleoporin Nup120/160-domain-containing protein [Neurospora hispaniola]|uniref:Nucleoporin Nup120/160-domain-containing protein n=1 Tax=Neurospora hispaniola TaxID=588809 RepID=A0AAJ0MNY7_9PEZI|nr:nucleoporin Nup120/160-domain-containing protein [Neurospora hispaniola]